MMEDADKDFGIVLSYLVGRRVSIKELLAALGISRSTYHRQCRAGTLTSPDNLIRVARHLGFNEVDLLERYGYLSRGAVTEYVMAKEFQRAAAEYPVSGPNRSDP